MDIVSEWEWAGWCNLWGTRQAVLETVVATTVKGKGWWNLKSAWVGLRGVRVSLWACPGGDEAATIWKGFREHCIFRGKASARKGRRKECLEKRFRKRGFFLIVVKYPQNKIYYFNQFLRAQFHSMKFIHITVQPSAPSVSRTSSSLQLRPHPLSPYSPTPGPLYPTLCL